MRPGCRWVEKRTISKLSFICAENIGSEHIPLPSWQPFCTIVCERSSLLESLAVRSARVLAVLLDASLRVGLRLLSGLPCKSSRILSLHFFSGSSSCNIDPTPINYTSAKHRKLAHTCQSDSELMSIVSWVQAFHSLSLGPSSLSTFDIRRLVDMSPHCNK